MKNIIDFSGPRRCSFCRTRKSKALFRNLSPSFRTLIEFPLLTVYWSAFDSSASPLEMLVRLLGSLGSLP
jgi:hypothetical protein